MRTDHIRKRNMVMQVVLTIITLGIYVIYWYHSTLKELHIANGKGEGAAMWTIFLFPPILNYFTYWHYSSEFGAFTHEKYPSLVAFLAWVVFAPIVWILAQTELNKAADGEAA